MLILSYAHPIAGNRQFLPGLPGYEAKIDELCYGHGDCEDRAYCFDYRCQPEGENTSGEECRDGDNNLICKCSNLKEDPGENDIDCGGVCGPGDLNIDMNDCHSCDWGTNWKCMPRGMHCVGATF